MLTYIKRAKKNWNPVASVVNSNRASHELIATNKTHMQLDLFYVVFLSFSLSLLFCSYKAISVHTIPQQSRIFYYYCSYSPINTDMLKIYKNKHMHNRMLGCRHTHIHGIHCLFISEP